jgi:hypothetical protein
VGRGNGRGYHWAAEDAELGEGPVGDERRRRGSGLDDGLALRGLTMVFNGGVAGDLPLGSNPSRGAGSGWNVLTHFVLAVGALMCNIYHAHHMCW